MEQEQSRFQNARLETLRSLDFYFMVSAVAPTFLPAVAGSMVAGRALGWVTLWLITKVQHVPTAIIIQ